MSLAHVIVSLDTLTPSELEVVSQVIALRSGTRPTSPTEPKVQKTGLFGRRKGREPLTPALSTGNTLGVDPVKAEFIESNEAQRLMEAVSALSQPLDNGPGRKREMLHRASSVITAWNEIPLRLQRPFRAVENRTDGQTPSPPTAEARSIPGWERENPVPLPAELSSGTEDDLSAPKTAGVFGT